jgi:hypothetical protein
VVTARPGRRRRSVTELVTLTARPVRCRVDACRPSSVACSRSATSGRGRPRGRRHSGRSC